MHTANGIFGIMEVSAWSPQLAAGGPESGWFDLGNGGK